MTKRKYDTWKLFVHKINNSESSEFEIYQIYVVDDVSLDVLVADRKYAANKIRELRDYYKSVHKEHIHIIDKQILRPLWRELNKNFVDAFARVSQGISLTVHKSQSSSFYNVFVDMDDIFKNNRIEEAKKCLYTAITRTSNILFILI